MARLLAVVLLSPLSQKMQEQYCGESIGDLITSKSPIRNTFTCDIV
jgi:hypothetical protein